MALEEFKGYLVKCDKCGTYLGDETDWVLQMDEITKECEENGWDINKSNIYPENHLINIHRCPKCKNNNKK